MTELTGSYLISQSGNIMKVDIHVPSTTYMGRGIYRLSPTDMEFLLNEGLITLDEAYSMLLQDYLIFINNIFIANVNLLKKNFPIELRPYIR